MADTPLECPECGALEFSGGCPTCVETRAIRFGKSWFQEAVDLALNACKPRDWKEGAE